MNMIKDKDKEPEKKLVTKAEIKDAWKNLKNPHELPASFLNALAENVSGFLIIHIDEDGNPIINFQPGNSVNSLALVQQAGRWAACMENYHSNIFLKNLSQNSGDEEMMSD